MLVYPFGNVCLFVFCDNDKTLSMGLQSFSKTAKKTLIQNIYEWISNCDYRHL